MFLSVVDTLFMLTGYNAHAIIYPIILTFNFQFCYFEGCKKKQFHQETGFFRIGCVELPFCRPREFL